MKITCNIILIFLFTLSTVAKTVKVSGIVEGAEGAGPLIGAQVYAQDKSSGTATDIQGRFSIEVNENTTIIISYIGYTTQQIIVNDHDTVLVLQLKPEDHITEEVEVKAKSLNDNIFTAQPGTYYLSAKQISLLPRFMGEADPLRAITMAPGVSQTEGTQGYSVRGSGREQNLILLNGAPVYNPSHLLGLFSIFNADAVREVTLIKSGIPSQYGGRLSSVMLVESGPGKPSRTKYSGSIGMLASSLRISTPVVKDRIWVAASLRKTYLHLFMDPLSKTIMKGDQKTSTSYKFTDIDGSIEYKINVRNYIDACFYYGNDAFNFKNSHNNLGNSVVWGNQVGSLRWRFIRSERFSWTNTITYSGYKFGFEADQSVYSMSTSSEVNTYGFLSAAYYQFSESNAIIRWGIDSKLHKMKPSDIKADVGGTDIVLPETQILSAVEPAIYIHLDYPITEKTLISAGLRGEYFAHLGPYMLQVESDKAGGDTISYRSAETVNAYTNVQPRLSARYLLNESSSLKASYSYTVQNIHLASMSSTALPADIWYPATKGVKPMIAHQVTAGYFIQLNEGKYLASLEVFGKRGMNIGELKDDFFQLYNTAILSQSAYYGDLYSYGTELSLTREVGRLTGSASVTVSRSKMKVENLNNGNAYLSQYDKPIDGTVFTSYKINEKWSIAGMFVYSSGKTATMPIQRHVIQGHLINIYSERNQYRMPDYHRLDISATRKFITSRRLHSELVLSIYNVYSRLNPYYVYYETEGDLEKMQLRVTAKAVSYYPILPSIAWRFTF